MTQTITIPWAICQSKNAKYTRWSNNRIALNDEYRDAKEAIGLKASEQFNREPYDWPVALVLQFYEPTRHRRDIANYTQALYDGMEGVVYEDDYWLYATYIFRAGKDTENPRIEVEVIDLDTYTLDFTIREGQTDIGFSDE